MRERIVHYEAPHKVLELDRDAIYSVRDVAEMLDLSYPTITWRARAIGISRQGNRYEFRSEDVVNILSYQDKRLMINRGKKDGPEAERE